MALRPVMEDSPPNGATTKDLVAMHDHLDELWQQYLTHLDRYQKAQNDLQRQLSSVCASISQLRSHYLTE